MYEKEKLRNRNSKIKKKFARTINDILFSGIRYITDSVLAAHA